MKKNLFTIAMASLLVVACKNETAVNEDREVTNDTEQTYEADKERLEALDREAMKEELLEEKIQGAPALPYKQARGYIVKKNHEVGSNAHMKIESKAEFDKVFIKASTIGWKGETTTIDWNKQYVIAVIEPKSEQFISIAPSYATKEGDEIYIRYAELEGEDLTREYSPSMILLVDKEYNGNLNIKKRNR